MGKRPKWSEIELQILQQITSRCVGVKDADVYLLSRDSPRHHTLPFAVSQAFFDGRWMVCGLWVVVECVLVVCLFGILRPQSGPRGGSSAACDGCKRRIEARAVREAFGGVEAG